MTVITQKCCESVFVVVRVEKVKMSLSNSAFESVMFFLIFYKRVE